MKLKTVYICSNCGFRSPKWNGRCQSCGEWNSFEEDVEESLQAGMNAHLFKPVDPDLLYETMARLIAEAKKTIH